MQPYQDSSHTSPASAQDSPQFETLLSYLRGLVSDSGFLVWDVLKVAQIELKINRMSLVCLLLLGVVALILCISIVISCTALVVYLLAQTAGLGWATALAIGVLGNVLLLTALGFTALVVKREIGWTRTKTLLCQMTPDSNKTFGPQEPVQ